MSRTEKETFEAYARRFERSLNYLASRVSSKSSMDFEDARQELLLSMWKAYKLFDPDKGCFSTYAVTRMRNRSKTLLAKHARPNQPIAVEEEVLDSIASSSEEEHEATLNRVVLDVIECRLATRVAESKQDERAYKMFVMMRTGMSMSDCARKMNVRVSWLSRIFRDKVVEPISVLERTV